MAVSMLNSASARWNAKSLNAEIAPLSWNSEGDPEATAKFMTSSPANEVLPRARFSESTAQLERMMASGSIFLQMCIFTVYSKSLVDLKSYEDKIIAAFENSQTDVLNPFAIVGGCVFDMTMVDLQKAPLYAEVKYLEVVFRCRYTVPRVFQG